MQSSTSIKQALPDVPADVAELAEKLGVLMRCTMQTGDSDFFALIDDLQLSFTQFKILVGLWEDDSERPLRAVGDSLGLSLPAVSRAVDGLVQRGLVTRTEDAADRRSKLISATGDGRELLDRIVKVRARTIVDLAASLDQDERAALSDALSPVVDRALERSPHA